MITLRKSNERGKSQSDWLQSYHTFSFADYYDSAHMQFGTLRVINEDFVSPGKGFGMHQHQDMEIITYIVEGELSHNDSMGNGSTIKPGEIQRMTAGTGVKHSEFNHSPDKPVHLLQIWILPNEKNLSPSYEQVSFNKKRNEFILIGSNHHQDNAVKIHQNVKLLAGFFDSGTSLEYIIEAGHQAWLQVIKGELNINGIPASAGDGVSLKNENILQLTCNNPAECLLFDLG